MEYKLLLTDEKNNVQQYNLVRSSIYEERNVNDFILALLRLSEDKRKLPIKIQYPDGTEVYPSIKMKFENYGSSILGQELEAIHIT